MRRFEFEPEMTPRCPLAASSNQGSAEKAVVT